MLNHWDEKGDLPSKADEPPFGWLGLQEESGRPQDLLVVLEIEEPSGGEESPGPQEICELEEVETGQLQINEQ